MLADKESDFSIGDFAHFEVREGGCGDWAMEVLPEVLGQDTVDSFVGSIVNFEFERGVIEVGVESLTLRETEMWWAIRREVAFLLVGDLVVGGDCFLGVFRRRDFFIPNLRGRGSLLLEE